MKIVTLVVCFLAIPALHAAGLSPSARADQIIEQEMRRYRIVGVSVGVRVADRVVHEKSYGLANVELSVPTRPAMIYQLSSTTKVITGTALLKLFIDRKLSLDATARTFLPELPEQWSAVTVRQLASHLSGLPDVVDIKANSAEEAIEILATKPVVGKPGERWRYNQTNYMLMRRIIERLSGEPFETYLARNIFAPAGMTSTLFAGSPFELVSNRATSYEGVNGVLKLREYRFSQYNNGAAGLNSSVPDLLRFDAALRDGRIVPKEALNALWQPSRLSDGTESHYAIGWSMENVPGHRSAGHEGGGATTIRRFIDDDATVVLLTNGARDRWDVEDLVERVVAVWKPEIRAPQDALTDRMLIAIEAENIGEARAQFLAFRTANPSLSTQGAMNRLGYRLLRRRMIAPSVAVFQWNVAAYPDSANAHDSLGEALLAKGDRTAARAAYERALQLEPAMESAKKALETLR